MTARTVDLGDGRKLRVLESGAGKPLVLLHGWPTNADAWSGQLTNLAGHRVVALDLPGFGASTPLVEPTVADIARSVRDFLELDGIDDAVLVGWSMGGLTVLSYCEQFGSERLRGIGIVDVSPRLLPGPGWVLGEGTPFSPEGIESWSRLWEDDRRAVVTDVYTIGLHDFETHLAQRERLVEESLKADPATAMVALLDAFAQDYRDVLPSIDVPALLLYGAHSTSTTPFVRDFMARELRDATLVVFEDSSHCLMVEQPELFNQAVDEFACRI